MSPLAGQEVEQIDYTTSEGVEVAAQSIVIPAPIGEVWKAFTTSEGVMSWAAPFAHVDFRIGGIWESAYDPKAKVGDAGNIRNRYLAFLPERMIALQAVEAPPDFPHPEVLEELFSVVEFEDLGEAGTRVEMYGVGYRDTPAHQAVREMFRQANAWSLRPSMVSWAATWGPSPSSRGGHHRIRPAPEADAFTCAFPTVEVGAFWSTLLHLAPESHGDDAQGQEGIGHLDRRDRDRLLGRGLGPALGSVEE